MTELLVVPFLGALFGLDITAIGQFMISRPIVCGPVIGYVLGDVKSGLWMGMIVELMWSRIVPMGAAIPHNTTVITIFAVVWGVDPLLGTKGGFIAALVMAALMGIIDKRLDIFVRSINVRISHWVEDGIKDGKETRLNFGVLLGIFVFFIKAFLVYLLFIEPGQWFLSYFYPKLPLLVKNSLDLAWWLLPLAGFGTILANFNYKFISFKYGK